MQIKSLFFIATIGVVTGCQTMQTPQQRQQIAARQQAANRMTAEHIRRLQGQLESVEMENARLMQEMQQLRSEVSSYSGRISKLDASLQSLETKQTRSVQEVVKRVENLLKKKVSTKPTPRSGRGSGREHLVESGHTLSAIAQAYGTTVSAIKQANNLTSDNIRIGQKLFIPE